MIVLGWDVGIRDLAYCVLDVQSATALTVLEWKVVDIRAPKMPDIVGRLCDLMWSVAGPLKTFQPDHVFIEQQFQNERMTSIASCLQCCSMAMEHFGLKVPKVTFVSSKARMRLVSDTFQVPLLESPTNPPKPKFIKDQAVALARAVLEKQPENDQRKLALETLNNASRETKDDFADSFLIGLTGALRVQMALDKVNKVAKRRKKEQCVLAP